MNREDSSQVNIKGPDIAAEDIRFMRSVVERSDRQIRPEGYVLTACGLICLICYPTVYFLLRAEQQKWILPVFLTMMIILLGYVFFALTVGIKRQKKEGYVPQIPRQVTFIWFIVALHILAWSISGTMLNNYCGGDPGFIAAMGLSIALSSTGILYSREYLYGGIFIFACMFLTYFVKDFGYIILGIATASGCIVPELICRRKFNEQVQKNG
jgi:hypothetical protein